MQPGWQVVVESTPIARPLVEALVEGVARRGAYALVRLHFAGTRNPAWATEAPLEILERVPSIEEFEDGQMDAIVVVDAPANTRDEGQIDAERRSALQRARAVQRERVMTLAVRWNVCIYPTPAHAQEAGMATSEFEDFLYRSVLLDWDAEERRMERIREGFDGVEEVRVVADGTDLRLSLAGRTGVVSAGYRNMPDGEVFYSPVEGTAEGVVTYSEFAASYLGNDVEGVRLRFEGGRVVDASARSNERFLLAMLDTDDGARVLGEFGIGCNPGVDRYTRNVGFDEKMAGTVHLAVGAGYRYAGGTNESAIHWDMVKDLRAGGRLYCDGQLVQEDGRWLI